MGFCRDDLNPLSRLFNSSLKEPPAMIQSTYAKAPVDKQAHHEPDFVGGMGKGVKSSSLSPFDNGEDDW